MEANMKEKPPKKLIKKGGVKHGWNIPSNRERNKGWKDKYLQPQIDNRADNSVVQYVILTSWIQ